MSKLDFGLKGYRLRYRIPEILSPKHIYRELKHFMQRGLYGYDDTYWWGLDYEIAELLVKVMPRYKNSNGMPMCYFHETAKGEYNWNSKTTKAHEKRAYKLRNDEIDFIVDGLKSYADCVDDRASKAMELFAKRFGTWWD